MKSAVRCLHELNAGVESSRPMQLVCINFRCKTGRELETFNF